MKSIKHNVSGKILVDQCQQININEFIDQSKKKLKEEFIKTSIVISGVNVYLAESKLFHGGIRYWFKCPSCKKRVGKLYKHPISNLLACRTCNNLDYRSRRFKGMIESDTK